MVFAINDKFSQIDKGFFLIFSKGLLKGYLNTAKI